QVQPAFVHPQQHARSGNGQPSNVQGAPKKREQRESHVDRLDLGDQPSFRIEKLGLVEDQVIAAELQPLRLQVPAQRLARAGKGDAEDALSARGGGQVDEPSGDQYGDQPEEAEQPQADPPYPLAGARFFLAAFQNDSPMEKWKDQIPSG